MEQIEGFIALERVSGLLYNLNLKRVLKEKGVRGLTGAAFWRRKRNFAPPPPPAHKDDAARGAAPFPMNRSVSGTVRRVRERREDNAFERESPEDPDA